jgi:hypothetical protein
MSVQLNGRGEYIMHGLGKPRTKLGCWLDERKLTESWLIENSGINKNTVTSLCGDTSYLPSGKTMQRVLNAVRSIEPEAKADQFWEL